MNNRRKQLVKYITPSILSMVSFFLYTIVDGIFVGRGVGTDALGAVNIAFPYVMIHEGLIMMCTIGGMTITAIRMGRKDNDGANESFMHSIVLCVCIATTMCLVGIFLTEPVCRLLGADDTFITMTCDYLFWYSIFFLPCGMFVAFNGTVRNDSSPALVSVAVITSTILNIIGDWILIFPLQMGIKGAAIATGIAQCVGLVIVMTHFIRKKGILRFRRFKFNTSLVKRIFVRGLPECINQFLAPVTTIVFNIVLLQYIGSVGVNAFALISYVATFAVAVFLGVAEGIQPLLGRSYGEGNESDLKYYFKWGMIISFTGSVIIVIMLFFTCPQIYSLFDAEPQTLEMALIETKIFSLGFLIESLTTIITAYLYSTTRTKPAVIINVLRTFVVNIAVILIMPAIFGPEALWYSFVVFEGIVLVVAVLLLKKADRGGIVTAGRE